jgi:hypothetical protein
MTANVQLVAIGDDTLEAIQQPDGTVWVSVRRVCEVLGLNPDGQRTKLGAKQWARTEIIYVRDSAGRQQAAFALHLDCLPMWLATIDRVRPEMADKLRLFQLRARDVLAEHFLGVKAPASPSSGGGPPSGGVLGLARVMLEALEDHERRLEAEKAARVALEGRVENLAETAGRALELADRASRAGVQARVSRDRIQAAVGHLSRRVQQHCAAHGLDFATVFREGRRDIGLRPTKEGGPSLGKANLRPDQVLRLARFYASQGVAGCSPRIVEEIMHGGGDDAALEVTV